MGLDIDSQSNIPHHNVDDSMMLERNGIVRNGATLWKNSGKAWEQVGWKSHKVSEGAEGTKVLCIGYQKIFPQVAIEEEPDTEGARQA